MAKTKHYHCPVNGWDCPHYVDTAIIAGEEEYCLCGMGLPGTEMEDLDPYDECDDFYGMYGDDASPIEYADYVEE